MEKKVPCLVLVAVLLAAILTGCVQPQPRTLIDTDTLKITREGKVTSVFDRMADDEYTFIKNRVRRSDAPKKPRRAVSSPTITVDLLPGGGLEISDLTGGKVYIIKSRKGVFHNGD